MSPHFGLISISTVGANGCADGPHRDFWAASLATGDAATGKGSPFTANQALGRDLPVIASPL